MMDGALKPAMTTHPRTRLTPKEAVTVACFIEYNMGIVQYQVPHVLYNTTVYRVYIHRSTH